MSRKAIEKLSASPFEESTALISITDAGYTFAKLKNKPEHLLQVAFDDVDNDVFKEDLGRSPKEKERLKIEKKYNMLTDNQASEIADFIKSAFASCEVIICQCEHGQSRSAAVAAAILEYKNKSGIAVFADDRYYPNKVVFRKVLKALKT